MKILIPVDPELPVPPVKYGGVERIVDGLISEYTKYGHNVILLANKNSTSKDAQRIYSWKNESSRGLKNIIQNSLTLLKVYKNERPDIIHSFSRLLYIYPTLLSSNVNFVISYGRFISPRSTALASILGGKNVNFTSAAKHMLKHLKTFKHKFTPIYNFTNTDYFIPVSDPTKDFLIFLGRIEDIKGTKEAIEVALRSKNKIIIAGNINNDQQEYFNKYVKPHLSNPLIKYVGPVNDSQKRLYLQHAKAAILPFKLKTEAFGLTLIEAMSCGTPVITFNIAATPEIVTNNIDGFITNSVDEMVEAVYNIDKIDRQAVRKNCVKKFSRNIIAKEYLELFERILKDDLKYIS